MKKRVLSLLLLLAMLLSMVPTMAFGSAAETEEEPPRSEVYTPTESFYSLYKKENLVAFFDALDPNNGTLDLANGKWYAKVVDSTTGELVKSDKIFAEIVGGAYSAENLTGWQVRAGGGFGYDDPTFEAEKGNLIRFDYRLLSQKTGNLYTKWRFWTVENLLTVNVRENPVEESLKMTTYLKEGDTAFNTTTEGTDITGDYKTKVTVWPASVIAESTVTILLKGTANATAKIKVKTEVKSADNKTSTFPEEEHDISFDAEGNATLSLAQAARTVLLAVYTPADVEVASITMANGYLAKADGIIHDAFQFAHLSVYHWSNRYGPNGQGCARISVSNRPGYFDNTGYTILTNNGDSRWINRTNFKDYDGQRQYLVVSKETSADGNSEKYSFLHGKMLLTGVHQPGTPDPGANNTPNAVLKDDTQAFHVMKGEQGTVYAVRVYANMDGAPLSEKDRMLHASLDTLIRLGVSIDKFNELSDADKEVYLLETVPTLPADATKADAEAKIDARLDYLANKEAAKTLTEYDKLYVGAEGKKTATGGKMTALFNGFEKGSSAFIENGTWVNKVEGGADATLGNSHYWEKRTGGGVGFDIFYGQLQADGATVKTGLSTDRVSGRDSESKGFTKTRLDFGIDMLPDDDYTVEYTAKYNPIYVADVNGNIALDQNGEKLSYYVFMTGGKGEGGVPSSQYAGAVDKLGFIASYTINRDGVYTSSPRGETVWKIDKNGKAVWESFRLGSPYVKGAGGSDPTWGGGGLTKSSEAYHILGSVQSYAIVRDKEKEGDVITATYSLLRGAYRYAQETLSSAKDVNAGDHYFAVEEKGEFFLSSMVPTDFYAVRIYNTVLTEEEMKQNTFVDMAASVSADLSEYALLGATEKALVHSLMASQPFPKDKEEFENSLRDITGKLANPVDAKKSFYITEGLRVLTTAYKGHNTGYLDGGANGFSWFNGADPDKYAGEFITAKGKHWKMGVNGGWESILDYTQYVNDTTMGLYLTQEMLPAKSYSLEMVVNPTGIVEYSEDGTTYTRYIDDKTTYGIHTEHGFTIGPLRCLIFPAARPGGGGGGMEKRWCYNYGTRMWNGLTDKERALFFTESQWKDTKINEIVSYGIDYDLSDIGGAYTILHNYTVATRKVFEPDDIISNGDALNMFQLMVRMPGAVFAVRVYDRVLTEAEKLQNHAADIIYYYNLDTTLLDQVLSLFKGDVTKVFRGFSDMSFDLTAEEAQRIFDERLGALWLSYAGLGIRNDYTEGLRYYFDLDETTAVIMINAGYQLEVGAIVNIGQNAIPSLEGRNYDYRIVAYDTVGGKNSGFFVDEDTFAVTIKASAMSREALLTSVNVLGYIKLTSQTGEELLFYIDVTGEDYSPTSFFEVYDHMQTVLVDGEDPNLLNYLDEAIDTCYLKEYVYLKAGAPAGGNGTKDSPYNDFATAFAASKDRLGKLNVPTYLYLQADDGIYEMREAVEITGKDNPYRYARFVVTSRRNKTVLTSGAPIDAAGFVQTQGNIWTYQFEKDANGNYPKFRYLYVNGEIADLAHNGAASINEVDAIRYESVYQRYVDGPLRVAYEMNAAGTLTMDEWYYPAEKVALRSRFAYYRDQFMAAKHVLELSDKGELTFATQPPISNPTALYMEKFAEFKQKIIARDEIRDVAKAIGVWYKVVEKFTPTEDYEYVTKYTDATVEYKQLLKTMLADFVTSLEETRKIDESLATIKLDTPVLPQRPAETDKSSIVKPFSSGVFETVSAMKNSLTHTTAPLAADMNTVVGLQFVYYRDAFLALADVMALSGDALNVNAVAPDAEGSEQYKQLFTRYLYERIAGDELRAQQKAFEREPDGAIYWKSKLTTAQSQIVGAPAGYYAVYNELRDAGARANFESSKANVKDYTTGLAPTVKESDAPYEGNIPMYDPRDEAKVYLNKDLIADQSAAIAEGLARQKLEAATIMQAAYEKYTVAYNKMLAAFAEHARLAKFEGADRAQKYEANLTKARMDADAAYSEYLAAKDLAARYCADEYDDRYTLKDSGLEFMIINEWNYNIFHVTGVDYSDKILYTVGNTTEEHVAVYLNMNEFKNIALHGEHHWSGRVSTVQFSREYVDKNNEYYYDAVAGKLYYYNEEGVSGLKFEYPTLTNMIYLDDVDRVTVSRLTFTCLDDLTITEIGFTGNQAAGDVHDAFNGRRDYFPSRAPIYGWQLTDVSFEGCTFHDLGCEGVTLRGRNESVTISDNSFERLGSAAIRVGGSTSGDAGWSATAGSDNVLVTNNYINGTGRFLICAPAVNMQFAKDSTISYNTIMNASYTGISIGWSWTHAGFMYGEGIKLMHCDVSYNYITNFMMEMADGGAIYTLGGNAHISEHRLFNWCHDNYLLCSNLTGDGEHGLMAMYHDGSSSHWETYNNVIVAYSCGADKRDDFTDEFFATVDTPLSKDEYLRRMRNRGSNIHYIYTQTVSGADADNITLRDNFYINCRSTIETGTKAGSQHYEVFKGRARESFYIYVKNMRYVVGTTSIPAIAENIIYEAGCDWYKGDPADLYDNNY